jgi:glycosyltransferase involved in cell wall biosynthesis
MEQMSGILFVSHDATRTGAPIALLHFLRWFKTNGNRPFSVLLGGGGELVADFEKLADTWSIDHSRWCPGGRRAHLLAAIGLGEFARRAEARDTRRFAAGCSPALVYVNSISSAPVIDVLAPQLPILTHVHELKFAFHAKASPELSRLLASTHKFIACSNAVRENLVREYAAPSARVETVYESIPVDEVRAERAREQVHWELHIPDDALLVVGSGLGRWRKGTDLFVDLARAVCRQHGRAYFAWVGGGSAEEIAHFEHDVTLAGLTEKMRLTGAVKKPADYFAAADVFALTSREDPYPLVCLEAAALGKPIVCFAGAGGMPEFVEGDCGFVVPYLDIMAMADRVVSLLDSSDCRLTMGAAARRKVAQRHDIGQTAPRIMDIIERSIAGA